MEIMIVALVCEENYESLEPRNSNIVVPQCAAAIRQLPKLLHEQWDGLKEISYVFMAYIYLIENTQPSLRLYAVRLKIILSNEGPTFRFVKNQ